MVIYHNCDTLKLGALIHCICTGDYKPIIQAGKPTDLELITAWEVLYSEYLSLINHKEASYEIILTCEVQALFCRYISISRGIEHLYQIADPVIIEMLEREGYIVSDVSNRDAYFLSLKKCASRLKRLAYEYEDKKAMLSKLSESAKNETKTPKAIFTHTLAVLARFQHCAVIHPKDITVAQYAAILNQYMEHCAAMEKK